MTRYALDPDRSRVWIEARSSLHPIHSETSGLEGWFEADVLGGGRVNPSVVPHGELELPMDLLSSGNPLYDREMRRRVDARRYPTISGRLTSMKETDRTSRYIVEGDITFRGVTHNYEDEMSLTVLDDATIGLEGQRVFDIRDFGMEPPRILALRVYPDVSVRVSIVATSTTKET
ncbi:MAG: YceI family protein [Acidimicrobiales bacterium]